MKARYYDEMNIARGIAVLLVLLGHSFPDAQTGISNPVILWVHSFLYSFHMGCFFVLSGFVIGNKVCEADFSLGFELKKKVQRLIVPYLFYSVITMGLKQIFAAFANNQFDISAFWTILLGQNPNGGLWYLWNLFVMSVLVLLLSKIAGRIPAIIYVGIGLVLYFASYCLQPGFYSRLLQYTVFFTAGILLRQKYEKVQRYFCNIPAGIVFGVVLIILVTIGNVPYLLTGLSGTYVILVVSNIISKYKDKKIYSAFNVCGDYSYDIYLLSYFVQVPIRVVFYQIVTIPYPVVVFLMLALGFLVPFIASKYVIRKISFANKLLLGNWK